MTIKQLLNNTKKGKSPFTLNYLKGLVTPSSTYTLLTDIQYNIASGVEGSILKPEHFLFADLWDTEDAFYSIDAFKYSHYSSRLIFRGVPLERLEEPSNFLLIINDN